MVSGFQAAFWVGATIAAAGFVAALVLIRDAEVEVERHVEELAADGASRCPSADLALARRRFQQTGEICR